MLTFYLYLIGFCQILAAIYSLLIPNEPTNPKNSAGLEALIDNSDLFIPNEPNNPKNKYVTIKSKHLAVINFLAAIAIFSFNRIGQFFCVPVTWASIVLILFTLSMVIYPIFDTQKKVKQAVSFIHGIGFLTCLYCIIFYDGYVIITLLGSFLVGIGFFLVLLVIVMLLEYLGIKSIESVQIILPPSFFLFYVVTLPYIWLFQILKRFIYNDLRNKLITLSSCVLMLILTSFFVNAYKNVLDNKDVILNFDNKTITEIKSNFFGNYMLEKALGWGMIYHVEICIFDGWRPPMHDPFLVVANWFYRTEQPLISDFYAKKQFYKTFYPDVVIKKHCSCGIEESNTYFSDPRLN